jgi:hypothetical protein
LSSYKTCYPQPYSVQVSRKFIDNAVYTLLNTILTALNNKFKAKGLFCDVEKASDCVSHNILSRKLEIYGITGVSQNLYSQYFKDTSALA